MKAPSAPNFFRDDYVAVMVSSWLGGLGPGLLATALATIAFNFFVMEPHHSFDILEFKTTFQLGVFVVANVLISCLNESRLVAHQQADTNLQAWRKSEAQFAHLVAANVIGIFEAGLNGVLFEANDAFLRMVGYTREDLLAGRIRWPELIPPEYQNLNERSQQELQTTGVCTPFEQEYIRKDGDRVPVLLGLVMRDNQSIVSFVLNRSEFKRNEAKRQQAEAALLKLNQQLQDKVTELQTLLDVIPIGIGIAEDRECNHIRVNPAFAQLLNISPTVNASLTAPEHERPTTFKVYQNGQEMAPAELPLQAAARDGIAIHELEVDVVWENGTVLTLLEYAVPLLSQTGQPRGSIGAFLDITDRKRAELERVALLQQEQAAREEAERANRIKDEFLAVLSHELRSPLNPILGWTKLLQTRSFTPEKTAQALATIERNAKLQSQLIEDLLDVSRILQGKMVLNIDSVNLVTTIEAAIETVRLATEAKGIQIRTQLAVDGGPIAADAARLQQIVWNLLTNAVKFTPEGGQIDVRLTCTNGLAQLQVQDTGKGINPEFLPHVFDYFRQEDGATTRKFGGLGLGLALVQHLTQQHGGTVQAESAGEGQGATFTIRLPIRPFAPQTDEPLIDPQTDNLHHILQHVKILVVDDEADMRELTLTILETQGAEVKVAASGREALTLLEQWQPDLLISDIGMPDMDGYMLLRQVRSRAAGSSEPRQIVPAIALTAYASEHDQQQALAAGFQKHIAKPVGPEPLIKAIFSILQRSE